MPASMHLFPGAKEGSGPQSARLRNVRVEFKLTTESDLQWIVPLIEGMSGELGELLKSDITSSLKVSRARAALQRLNEELRIL